MCNVIPLENMAAIFKHGNSELRNLARVASLENLVAYFDARTAEWSEPIISMESFTVGIFYDLAQSFKGAAAFDLLGIAASMRTEHVPDKKYMRYVDLLAELAENADSTNMPRPLQRIWNDLIVRVEKIDAESIGLETLRKHYGSAG
ncbi:MAG: hypothetical protein CMM07_21820 [Rhodopirellula sp.]|nr:hypothetical protein [Rhodopirellula sp.]